MSNCSGIFLFKWWDWDVLLFFSFSILFFIHQFRHWKQQRQNHKEKKITRGVTYFIIIYKHNSTNCLSRCCFHFFYSIRPYSYDDDVDEEYSHQTKISNKKNNKTISTTAAAQNKLFQNIDKKSLKNFSSGNTQRAITNI